jgi:hypothetical protein
MLVTCKYLNNGCCVKKIGVILLPSCFDPLFRLCFEPKIVSQEQVTGMAAEEKNEGEKA